MWKTVAIYGLALALGAVAPRWLDDRIRARGQYVNPLFRPPMKAPPG